MRFNIIGRNIKVTTGLEGIVTEKLEKLDKYFQPDQQVNVTLSTIKDLQKVEVTIPMKGNVIRTEQEDSDMFAAVLLAQESIERQLQKYKNKLIDKHRAAAPGFSDYYAEEDYGDDDEIIIEKIKRFDVKPMIPEEACMQMELIGHSFFVFRNAETNEVNVVYKRKNGSYGLIEPES